MFLDETDRKLVSLLRTNARLPVSSLAATLGVSRGTVQNRIDRLMQEGVILGFTVRVKPDVEPGAVRAVMMIEIQGKAADKVLKTLGGYTEIRELHTTNGRWDVVAEIETESLEAFDRVLRDIRLVDGIAGTETSILLSSRKY